jgi:hypothetical protein
MGDNLAIFGSRLRVLYGIFFIVLGIVTAIVTYRYVFPTGSIVLVLSGVILIFWKRRIRMINSVV